MTSVQLFKNREGELVTIRCSDVMTARGKRPVRAYTNHTKLDALTHGIPGQHEQIAVFRAATRTAGRVDVIEDLLSQGQTISYFI
ncbi:hypothetical protein KJZ67_00660 [Patescibacteria group bacterium]|nr:hypothetical protein [Patescibacteria group bacterium]